MATELKFPTDFQTDTEFTDAALAEFRQLYGYHDTIQFGDLDSRTQSEVVRRAQVLKKEARQ
jgi:hypothetical protein